MGSATGEMQVLRLLQRLEWAEEMHRKGYLSQKALDELYAELAKLEVELKPRPVSGSGAGIPGLPLGNVVAPGGSGGMGGGGRARNAKRNAETRLEIMRAAAYLAASDKSPGTRRVLKALDTPISMSFANETPLEDILKYVKQATFEEGKTVAIPFYVDPRGLEEAATTLTAPIIFEMEGVPLKTTLRLMLKQIDLAYCVRDGVLIISSVEGIHQELEEANEERDLEEEVEASKPVNAPAPKREETPKNPQ